ncbi:MAG TPA: SgcJ/EcaC family oxidoreductase [Candidatus Eisenbacteria bacterium]|nr:SgcJ/EcaC family oxidoreductase [Candidatus Eisenbacteria bacterium]
MRFSVPERTTSYPVLFLVTLAAVGSVLLGSCSRPPADDASAARAGIVAADRDFMAAFTARDAAAMALVYTEDATLYPPNVDAVQGREAIAKFWESMLLLPVKELRLELVDVHGTGDTVTSEGRYTLLDDQDRTVEAGQYLVVWKKTAQGWRMYRDLWNADAPAAASPADTLGAPPGTTP